MKLKSKIINADLDDLIKEVQKKDKIRVNLWLDAVAYKKLKMIAVDGDMSLTSIINQLIRAYIEADR